MKKPLRVMTQDELKRFGGHGPLDILSNHTSRGVCDARECTQRDWIDTVCGELASTIRLCRLMDVEGVTPDRLTMHSYTWHVCKVLMSQLHYAIHGDMKYFDGEAIDRKSIGCPEMADTLLDAISRILAWRRVHSPLEDAVIIEEQKHILDELLQLLPGIQFGEFCTQVLELEGSLREQLTEQPVAILEPLVEIPTPVLDSVPKDMKPADMPQAMVDALAKEFILTRMPFETTAEEDPIPHYDLRYTF